MKKKIEFENESMLKHSSTIVISLIPILIGIIFIFFALSQFPGYSMIKHYVSHLGIGPKPSAQFFNVGVIIIGAASIHFFINLGKLLKSSGIDEILRKITIKLSILCGLFLSLVGCFPMFNSLLILHAIVSSSFFWIGAFSFMLFSYLMIKNNNFSFYQSFPGFLVALFAMVYTITSFPVFEWGVVFSGFFWVVFNGIWLGIKNLRIYLGI